MGQIETKKIDGLWTRLGAKIGGQGIGWCLVGELRTFGMTTGGCDLERALRAIQEAKLDSTGEIILKTYPDAAAYAVSKAFDPAVSWEAHTERVESLARSLALLGYSNVRICTREPSWLGEWSRRNQKDVSK